MACICEWRLKMANLVLSVADQFSINLQAQNITIQEATRGTDLLASHLKSLRSEEQFCSFYDQVIKQSASLMENPKLPRNRKVPRRYGEGASPHTYQLPKDRYRHIHFETLELAFGEVERRFDQSDLVIVKEIELLNTANGEVNPIPDCVLKFLENDVDIERLKFQLAMVTNMIKTTFTGQYAVTKVTNIRTIAQSEIYREMLTEIDKILKIYFTFPVTSATEERIFSALRRIKSFLRSNMTACRLNNLLMYITTKQTILIFFLLLKSLYQQILGDYIILVNF